MPSKLGPHYSGASNFERWIQAGTRVYKFDPPRLGASGQVPPGPLVIGKLDQKEDNLNLTDWKHYMNQGLTPQATAAHRFSVQQNIFVGPNKPRVNRYTANPRIDVWEDDNEVPPDDPREAQWYTEYSIEMMRQYEAIGKKRANFNFATGTPHIAPGDHNDIWPHLLPAVRHARDHGHYVALHEYMGYEADFGVGRKQVDVHRQRIPNAWHGRRDAGGNPVESYPYGYCPLRYRFIYDTYFRPAGLADTMLVITECGCDGVDSVTPHDMIAGSWTHLRDSWAAEGLDPESHYAGMLRWYDDRLREDSYVKGATVFTVGRTKGWEDWDIGGTRVEEEVQAHIARVRDAADTTLDQAAVPVVVVGPPPDPAAPELKDDAAGGGFTSSVDLNRVPAGQRFNATWVFNNTGETTWDGRYHLVYSDEPHAETAGNVRSPMGAPGRQAITTLGAPAQVKPGESASLTVQLTAPALAGEQATNWQMEAPDGRRFGPIRWLRAVVVGAAAGQTMPDYEVVSFANTADDFNNLASNQRFNAVWTVRNSGTATWSGDYRLTYLPDATIADTDGLARSPLGSPAAVSLREASGREIVTPGETVDLRLDLTAPEAPGKYAYHWEMRTPDGQAFGGVRWLAIGVAASGTGVADQKPGGGRPQPVTQKFAFGMNINPDAHGLDVDRLRGLGWVRLVFKADGWINPANRNEVGRNIPDAFHNQYRGLIQSYTAAGIRCLIIINQETRAGDSAFEGRTHDDWVAYAPAFAAAAGEVAGLCRMFGDKVAYQIWNEEDSGWGSDAGHANPSAIGLAPRTYAVLLDQAAAAVRANHPGAPVIFGGLKTGPGNGAGYAKEVQKALNGRLPVDFLALHPYGRFKNLNFFSFPATSTMENGLREFRKQFPNMKTWITEMGAANDTPLGPEHYANIATYLTEVVEEVADNWSDFVPVMIWFGWTDLLRNAGIVQANGQPKEHVTEAFNALKDRFSGTGGLEATQMGADAQYLGFEPGVADHNAVPAGTAFTSRWSFRNSGTTTWDDSYSLVYAPEGNAGHSPLSAATHFSLADVAQPLPAAPGDEVEFSLTLTAPDLPGRHALSRWELRDPDGESFGFVFAEITTVAPLMFGTGARAADMKYLRDVTFQDGERVPAGTEFNKQWLVRNTGGRKWGTGFRLIYTEGDLSLARGVVAHTVPPAAPGEEVVLTVPMTAPATPGTYANTWRLQDDRGNIVGEYVSALIVSTPAGVPRPVDRVSAVDRLNSDPTLWYSQLDPRWSHHKLGTGPTTMASWGCLLNCMAMGLSAFGLRLTPPELNERLTALGTNGFVGSDVQFNGPTLLLEGLNWPVNYATQSDGSIRFTVVPDIDPIRKIDAELARGSVVLAQVDRDLQNPFYDSGSEQHWVVLLRRTAAGDDYDILDPVSPPHSLGPISLMLKYGSRAPGLTNEENLRRAIKSFLVYHRPGGVVGG